MKKIYTVAQSQEHIAKVEKWLILSPMQRLDIFNKVNEARGKKYKTLSAALGACLKYL